MKYFHSVLLAVLFMPIFSHAQSNYKPGYVINLKGDTVRGFIDYREWDTNPATITFKSGLADNKAQKFTHHEITFINVDGLEVYKRYVVKISMDSTDPNLINGRDTSFKVDTVFLRLIQKGGRLELYSYFDGLKRRFYISDAPDYIPVELGYHVYLSSDGSQSSKTIVESTYMRQLYALAQKYNVLTDAFQTDIQRAEYSKSDMLNIVSKINGISGKELSARYDEKFKVGFFAGLAANVTSTTPTGAYQEAGGKAYSSILPAVSAGVNIFANPNTGRLIFRLEASLALGQYRSVYDNKVSPFVHITYSYKTMSLGFVPQIIYNFYNKDDFKFFGGFGLALNYYKYSSAGYKAPDGSMVSTAVNPFDFRAFNSPLMLKTGVLINKKIEIFGEYMTSSPVSDDYVFRLNFSSMQFGVNYYFK